MIKCIMDNYKFSTLIPWRGNMIYVYDTVWIIVHYEPCVTFKLVRIISINRKFPRVEIRSLKTNNTLILFDWKC